MFELASSIFGPVVMQHSSLAMMLFFGPLMIVWLCLELGLGRTEENKNEPVPEKAAAVQLSAPILTRAFRSFAVVGAICGLCYACEHHSPFGHHEKTTNPYMYWASFAVLICASLLTIRPCKDDGILNRDQTEEWKGWMQFLFLAYHYWQMESQYNDIRVYITCYLWMTGFGNFSFFWTKGDYTPIRVLQMLWRMNFACVFLMLTMGNEYIVYYICPLHSFFFAVAFICMACCQSLNYTKWGIRMKILVLGLFLYTYDFQGTGMFEAGGVYKALFGWLGTGPTSASIGAHGARWEWYFRSTLDHFSTMFGMIFALNFPYLLRWFKVVEDMSPVKEWCIKGFVLAIIGGLCTLWYQQVYSQPKLVFNGLHAYYGYVPLLGYIFIRNISKTFRKYHMYLLHRMGCITLETYLLQYHIWLSDNAGTLLTIVPGYPIASYLIASVMHFLAAQALFQATLDLRFAILPDNLSDSLRNLGLLCGSLAVCFTISFKIMLTGATMPSVVACVGLLGAVSAFSLQKLLVDAPVKVALVDKSAGKSKENHKTSCPTSVLVFATAGVVALIYTRSYLSSLLLRVTPPVALLSIRQTSLEVFELIVPFEVGNMASPKHGAIALAAAAIMLVTMDTFWGASTLALKLFGGGTSVSYSDAYRPLMEKMGIWNPADEETAEPQSTQAAATQ